YRASRARRRGAISPRLRQLRPIRELRAPRPRLQGGSSLAFSPQWGRLMAKRLRADRTLFIVTVLLLFVGLVMVFSASAVVAQERYGSPYAFFLRQLVWAIAGMAALVAAMKLDYRRLNHPAVVFCVLALTALLLTAVFFLDRSHNTHRWIRFGEFSFQPAELAKPAIILFLAYFLRDRLKWVDDWRHT